MGQLFNTYPFAMIVNLLGPVGAIWRTSLVRSRLLRVHLVVHGVGDEVLLEVHPPVLPHGLLLSGPEHGLAALVLAVKVLQVLQLTVLKATAFALLKSQKILLPRIIGDILRNLRERTSFSSFDVTTIC